MVVAVALVVAVGTTFGGPEPLLRRNIPEIMAASTVAVAVMRATFTLVSLLMMVCSCMSINLFAFPL